MTVTRAKTPPQEEEWTVVGRPRKVNSARSESKTSRSGAPRPCSEGLSRDVEECYRRAVQCEGCTGKPCHMRDQAWRRHLKVEQAAKTALRRREEERRHEEELRRRAEGERRHREEEPRRRKEDAR